MLVFAIFIVMTYNLETLTESILATMVTAVLTTVLTTVLLGNDHRDKSQENKCSLHDESVSRSVYVVDSIIHYLYMYVHLTIVIETEARTLHDRRLGLKKHVNDFCLGHESIG